MSMYLFLLVFLWLFRYLSLLPGEYSCLWLFASNCFVIGVVTTKIGVLTTKIGVVTTKIGVVTTKSGV